MRFPKMDTFWNRTKEFKKDFYMIKTNGLYPVTLIIYYSGIKLCQPVETAVWNELKKKLIRCCSLTKIMNRIFTMRRNIKQELQPE